MIPTNSSINQIPYKNNENLFKSEWTSSTWNRKQVRILVEETGKISVQTVVQSSFDRLLSQCLKFLACGRVKSFGKYVASYSSDFTLPKEAAMLLNDKLGQDPINVQSHKFLIAFLPKYQSLNDLGSKLCDYALDRQCGEAGRRKVLDMHEEILDFQMKINVAFLGGLTSADFLITIQDFEKQIEVICNTYPKELKEFIDKEEQNTAEPLTVENKDI